MFRSLDLYNTIEDYRWKETTTSELISSWRSKHYTTREYAPELGRGYFAAGLEWQNVTKQRFYHRGFTNTNPIPNTNSNPNPTPSLFSKRACSQASF